MYFSFTQTRNEAVYLSVMSPKCLRIEVLALLEVLPHVFAKYAFRTNWSKNKTEILVRMRGKAVRGNYADLVFKLEGSDVIVLPSCNGMVHAVESYKHVGTTLFVQNLVGPRKPT